MASDKSKVKNSTILKVFWQHAMKYPWPAFIIAFSTTLAVGLDALGIWYFKVLIDLLTVQQVASSIPDAVWSVVGIMFLIAFVRWILWRLVGFSSTYFQTNVMSDLQQTSFDYLLGHSYKFYSDNFSGSLVRKVGRISRSFERLADVLQFNFIPVIVIITSSVIGLSFRFPYIALIFFIWFVLFILGNYWAALWKMKIDIKRVAVDSDATGLLADALTNNLNIKLFNGVRQEQERYSTIQAKWKKLQIKGWNRGEIVFSVQHFFMLFFNFGLIIWGLHLWSKGVLTVGDLVLIDGYLAAVSSRLWQIGSSFRNVFESIADAGEMVEILELPYEVQDKPKAKKLSVKSGHIEFNKVSFYFQSTRAVLKDFNLDIKPQEKVALVGASGAGKTTITKLLFRFHDIAGGQILIDGQNIADVTQESLRQNIALVPQEPILFHRTLMENIRYGRKDASDNEVISAAKKARCHDFIKQTSEGYNTFVGERGIKLSGGERQRVAIARAILKNAPILVLDEATSSLDSESEQLIQAALAELMKDKTTIVIAHRLSTIMMMDRIIVIEAGKVVDSGTHQELLSKKGIYKKLWNIQAGGFTG